jgi:protein-L-isoaspartate(D-aspartate) O-methyltransferase
MILPVGEQNQTLQRITRRGSEFVVENIEAVRFVPLVKGELA